MADYPYMYARVSAKRAKLLESSDYDKLLKMEPNEIARNLEERDYREEINELGARHEGVELVELALDRNLSKTLNHISEIAPEKLGETLAAYLRRFDIRSIKRLLRWKRSGGDLKIKDMLHPAGKFTPEQLEDMRGMETEEIIEQISFRDSKVDYQNYLEPDMKLKEVERALDRAYFEELEILAETSKSPNFSRFIKREIEHENIRTALRLKKYGFKTEEIHSYMIAGRAEETVEAILESENLKQALQEVKEREEIEAENLEELENKLEVKRLQNALQMLHTEPLGVTSILGYVIAKITEVKNLRMLIRAKETGIQNQETIRRNLVTA